MRGLPFKCVREAGRLISVDVPKFSITIPVSREIAVLDTKIAFPHFGGPYVGVYLSNVSARRAG